MHWHDKKLKVYYFKYLWIYPLRSVSMKGSEITLLWKVQTVLWTCEAISFLALGHAKLYWMFLCFSLSPCIVYYLGKMIEDFNRVLVPSCSVVQRNGSLLCLSVCVCVCVCVKQTMEYSLSQDEAAVFECQDSLTSRWPVAARLLHSIYIFFNERQQKWASKPLLFIFCETMRSW